MKAIVIAIIVIAAMVLLGWLTISRTGTDPTVSLNTEQIREDTDKAVQATKEVGDKASREGEKIVDEIQKTDIDVDVRRKDEPETVEP
jgi:uncharacterized protein YxeA